jgi:hypothetical protein
MSAEWKHASALCKGAPFPLVWGDQVRRRERSSESAEWERASDVREAARR